MLDGAGLVDAWRHHHPHTPELSRTLSRELLCERFSRETENFDTHQPSGCWARVDHVLVPATRVTATTARIYSSIKPHAFLRNSDHIPVGVRIEI